MPVYLILDVDCDLPQALLTHLLNQPHTTAIAATRHKLIPRLSNTLQSLPRHETSSVIPAKLDLTAEHDAAVVVRGLIFGGVTQVDAVVLDVSTLTLEADDITRCEYEEGVARLLQHFRIVQADRARFLILGLDRLETSTAQMVDSRMMGCYGWTKVTVPTVVVEYGDDMPTDENRVKGVLQLMDAHKGPGQILPWNMPETVIHSV